MASVRKPFALPKAPVVGLKSNHTINNYIGYLKEAYLMLGLKRFATKSRQRVRAEKVYPIDVALMDGRQDAFAGDSLGWRLETIVYIELLRRNRPINRDIYYFKNTSGYEADFVVCKITTLKRYIKYHTTSVRRKLSRER